MSCRSSKDLYTDTTAQPEVTSAAATTFDLYTKDGGALNSTTAAERRYPGFLLDFFQRNRQNRPASNSTRSQTAGDVSRGEDTAGLLHTDTKIHDASSREHVTKLNQSDSSAVDFQGQRDFTQDFAFPTQGKSNHAHMQVSQTRQFRIRKLIGNALQIPVIQLIGCCCSRDL